MKYILFSDDERLQEIDNRAQILSSVDLELLDIQVFDKMQSLVKLEHSVIAKERVVNAAIGTLKSLYDQFNDVSNSSDDLVAQSGDLKLLDIPNQGAIITCSFYEPTKGSIDKVEDSGYKLDFTARGSISFHTLPGKLDQIARVMHIMLDSHICLVYATGVFLKGQELVARSTPTFNTCFVAFKNSIGGIVIKGPIVSPKGPPYTFDLSFMKEGS